MAFPPGTTVALHINGKDVGTITVRGHNHGWHFGDFAPNACFAEFAPLYGRWSLLMHADGADEGLSDAASEELRGTEIEMDRLHARIFQPSAEQWQDVVEINIDGPL